MKNDAPILLDVTRLIWRRWKGRYPTGIDRVCLAYLRHFGNRAQAVIQHDRFRRILDRDASHDLFVLLDGSPAQFRARLPWKTLMHLGGLDCPANQRLYLNIGHTGLDSPGFTQWIGKSRVRPIYFVHDLIPITHPQFCRAGEAERHRARIRTVLATAAGVIGNSEATLDELAKFASQERLPYPSAVAAWLGSDPLPVVRNTTTIPGPTFVALSTIEARKNHRMLLDIWLRLIHRFGDDAPNLLIIGQRGWEAGDVFQLLDQAEQFRGKVTELGHCPDEVIAQHLSNARALLFPSVAEGYGLPLVEALAAGTPVIASDLPVFHEIGGNIPLYLNSTDADAWERAILDFSTADSNARRAQISKMTGYRAPDWNSHFDRVERWLARFDVNSRDVPTST